jgi:glucose/mannose transport system substrate-binding protein
MVKRIIVFTVISMIMLTAAFAGGESESQSSSGSGEVESVVLTGEKPSGELEIFSWWAGDEGPALEALIDLYHSKHSGVSVNNATVTGGSGVNARAVLKTRMLGGDPPDSFQVHAGQELIGTWVVAERMVDLTPLYEQEGWLDVFPADLIKLLGTEDGIWSVPVNIHRSNLLWFVDSNLDKWGVDVPKTWDDFLKIAPTLESQGVVPLALGEAWTVNHLWESVALGVLGPDKWNKLWTGELSFTSADAVKVWEVFGEILEYTNTDAASLSWQQATDMVVNGEAAFNIMGDWAAGYMFTTLKLTYGDGFSSAPAPGCDGVFMMLSDSFGLPKGVKNETAVIEWLKLCGSREGQDAFNPLKGSISARSDSDMSLYKNTYLHSAAEDFQKDTIVGSLVHGAAANEGFMNDFSTIMGMFLTNMNPEQAANGMEAIAIQNGIQ